MAQEDLYQALGVSKSASKDEIQKAYRSRARKYHPDLNQNDKSAQEKFKRIQEAYDVLSDPEKRAAYDQYGTDFEKVRSGGPWQGGGFDGLDIDQLFGGGAGGGQRFQGGFGDFFEQILGGARGQGARRQAPTRGADVRSDVTVSLNTAVLGGKTELHLNRPSGTESLSVTIPPGVDNGSKIRLRGQGQPSPGGGPAGDLILHLTVATHPYFTRRGKHLDLKLPVTLAEAMLGAKVDVPTPAGTIELTIPAGSSGGKRLRIAGQGVRDPKGKPGDLFVELQIQLPAQIDAASETLIRQFDEQNPLTPRTSLVW